jgi:hypothetical protein
MGNIFISYRRGDSIATAGRIRDKLVQVYGRNRVFVDVDDIPHGRDFVKILESKVAECDVLLAIIGPSWLDSRDAKGNRRLEDKQDFVGIEIGSALQRQSIAVIPVLVDGAVLPTAEQLPEHLKPLARRNAIELRNTQFGSDADRLVRAIDTATGTRRSGPWGKVAAAIAVLALLGAGGYFAWPNFFPTSPPARETAVRTNPAMPPAAQPAAGAVDAKADVSASLSRLRDVLRLAEGHVTVAIRGGDVVKLGDQIVFEVKSEVAGRLILVDINARDEVTQIFPNSFVASEAAQRVGKGAPVTVPGPGYGFSGFKAVEPVGAGRLIALVVPDSVPAQQFALVQEQRTKGFQPVNAPGAYLDQLARQAGEATKSGMLADWGFARTSYEIVR